MVSPERGVKEAKEFEGMGRGREAETLQTHSPGMQDQLLD
jgi:hypothetical protein